MTYEVQQNRWDQTIRRASGSIGPGSRVAETIAELFPMFDVENLPAELLFLSGWILGQGAEQRTAVVAERSLIQIFNPVDSGKLTVLTRVDLTTSNVIGQQVRFGTTTTALALDVGNVIPRDTRAGIIAPLVTQVRSQTQPGNFGRFGLIHIVTGQNQTLEDQNGIVVLAPGTGWTVATTVVNSELTASFFWRERVALPSELNF